LANAGTTSASAASASAAASSYAAANAADVESSPAMPAYEPSLPTRASYWIAATWLAVVNESAAVVYAGASMTSLMAPPESVRWYGKAAPDGGDRDRRNRICGKLARQPECGSGTLGSHIEVSVSPK